MSLEAITWVIKQDIPDGVAKLVALVLADYADRHTGAAHPKINQLAEACSQSERTVQRKLRELQSLNVLSIRAGHCPRSGRQRANSYILHLPGIDVPPRGDKSVQAGPDPIARGDIGTPLNSNEPADEGCHTDTGEGDNRVTGEGDTAGTPLKNPSDSTVRRESPHPPSGGRRAFPKLFRGNGVAAPVQPMPVRRGEGTPALDPPTAAAFARLWGCYPEAGRIDCDRAAAERIFGELPPADQVLAVAVAAGYAAHIERHKARPKALHTWLRTRRFVNLAASTAPIASMPKTRVFVQADSLQWEAWAAYYRHHGKPMMTATWSTAMRADGWWFPSAMPPAAAA